MAIIIAKRNLGSHLAEQENNFINTFTECPNSFTVTFQGTRIAWIVKHRHMANDCTVEAVPDAYIAYDIDNCVPQLMPAVRGIAIAVGMGWRGSPVEMAKFS